MEFRVQSVLAGGATSTGARAHVVAGGLRWSLARRMVEPHDEADLVTAQVWLFAWMDEPMEAVRIASGPSAFWREVGRVARLLGWQLLHPFHKGP